MKLNDIIDFTFPTHTYIYFKALFMIVSSLLQICYLRRWYCLHE